jgi:hypothetical protein
MSLIDEASRDHITSSSLQRAQKDTKMVLGNI